MSNFLLLYNGGGMPETEEEQAAVMAAWGAWYGKLGDSVVDGGNPTNPGAKSIASDGSVSEGPVGVPVTGYTIISADNINAAVSKAKGCPILESGGGISVYEIFPAM